MYTYVLRIHDKDIIGCDTIYTPQVWKQFTGTQQHSVIYTNPLLKIWEMMMSHGNSSEIPSSAAQQTLCGISWTLQVREKMV